MTPNGEVEGPHKVPDQSRGCTLSSRTRGDTTEFHGPLESAHPSIAHCLDPLRTPRPQDRIRCGSQKRLLENTLQGLW